MLLFGERSPRGKTDRERGKEREGEASLRIMERQLASGFCSAIEAITLHYADSAAEGEGEEEAKHFHMN